MLGISIALLAPLIIMPKAGLHNCKTNVCLIKTRTRVTLDWATYVACHPDCLYAY